MTYTLPQSGQRITARPGQFIRCNTFCEHIANVDRLTNGLGMNFRAMPDGTLRRIIF